MSRLRTTCRWAARVTAVIVGACAQASPPPGGTPDRLAPRIVETTPAQDAVVPTFSGPVRFKFDETLSERGVRTADMAVVSPETGEVKIGRHGNELRVSIAGDWQPGRVYHVVVLPGIQDRRANARREAYELVFSTGPPILPTVLGGLVSDRLTGRPVANARVVAVSSADSAAYVSLTDTAGFFAFRSLPLGKFRTTAFVDANRNKELDDREPRDFRLVDLTSQRDTPIVELSMLAPDTTPARLVRAEARDSLQVRVRFDDFIAAEEPLGGVDVTVRQLPDSIMLLHGQLLHVKEFEDRQRAARDSARMARDTTRARADTVPPAAIVPAGPPEKLLPTQELIYIPGQPLMPGVEYRITVAGIRNIAGVTRGGGSATFETAARPRPAPRDTTAKPAAKPDTIRL